MLRPKQMSRVSVTGSARVMADVIETVHELGLVHLSDYDASIEGFDPGNPIEGADEAADKLVTVRALKNTLDVTDEHAGPTRVVTDEELDAELETVRKDVNELDDRRDEIRSELNDVETAIEELEFFVQLGIDLDLLSGYDTIDVAVGEGDPREVEQALDTTEAIDAYRVFAEGRKLAAFARVTAEDGESTLQDALVGATFTAVEVPDAEGDPEEYLEDRRHRKQQLESRLQTVEDEIEEVKLDVAGFLLAAEEKLAIEVQKREAPLSFATTENAFVAEGWVPTERVADLETALDDAVGDHVDVDELERAEYDEDGNVHDREEVEAGESGPEATIEESTEEEAPKARTDGGIIAIGDDRPPIIQDTPDVAKPFEPFVKAVGLPSYSELDPTVVLLLTFPAFFGFMIGDVGYGLLYLAIGAAIYTRFEPGAIRSMGGVAMWAGGFTILFGVLYGEVFGTHLVTSVVWEGIVGLHSAPIHKGLQPADLVYARAWLALSLLVGLLHLTIGYAFSFVNDLTGHGFRDAVYESGSWLLMMFGIWAAVFSQAAATRKPSFLFAVFARPGMPLPGTGETITAHEVIFPLGFNGFPPVVAIIGLVVFAAGFVLLALGEPIEIVEFLNVLVNVLSYTRIAAVLLAKAGMAFVVNLLFFGVGVEMTEHGEVWHFLITETPEQFLAHHEAASIMFGGLIHTGVAGLLGGLVILVLGHVLVLALGVTSAGLQAVRLEYVEFFGKFYTGNGTPYDPFGYVREHTTGE